MGRTIKSLRDVVNWGLCTGCGACFSVCDQGAVTLVNIESVGIRPRFELQSCASCSSCLSICPGCRVTAGDIAQPSHAEREFGPALEIWEGYAADPELRLHASSGGILSALALYCLAQESAAFVVHSGIDPEVPWANKTVRSRSREDLLACTGSRYSPASPCDDLRSIEDSDQPCVFIGKPCDTAAVTAMRKLRPRLDGNLALVMSCFCAGTPSTAGTLDLMKDLKVDLSQVTAVHYRGDGWPGDFKIIANGSPCVRLTYEESWTRLTHYRPLRCNLCPDGLGRVSDLACGDAWEQHKRNPQDPGRSIILVRTRRGQEVLRRAVATGYVHLEPVTPETVFLAQGNLLARRRELFGRLLVMRLFGIPIPQFIGFSLFYSWMELALPEKLRTLAGTLRRILRRGWWKSHMPEQQLSSSATARIVRSYGEPEAMFKSDYPR